MLLTNAGGEDTTAPVVTVTALTTSDTTPELTGTIDDSTATIAVTVAGNEYDATNNGNGTWTLADNTITTALAVGTYDFAVSATDAAGNVETDGSSNELEITQTVLDKVFYGTAGSDTVTGNELDNIIWGISQASAEIGEGDIGARTTDTLIGGAGNDVFVLGDVVRVFYDDGFDSRRNNGTNDYALIEDFQKGFDKIQLSSSNGRLTIDSYHLEIESGITRIYWDSNGDTILDSRDELIAIVVGETNLETEDFSVAGISQSADFNYLWMA
jgi:hypothetical protein